MASPSSTWRYTESHRRTIADVGALIQVTWPYKLYDDSRGETNPRSAFLILDVWWIWGSCFSFLKTPLLTGTPLLTPLHQTKVANIHLILELNYSFCHPGDIHPLVMLRSIPGTIQRYETLNSSASLWIISWTHSYGSKLLCMQWQAGKGWGLAIKQLL